jgi:hypothetical protein
MMSTGYEQFADQLEDAITAFPSLSIAVSGGNKILKGTLPVVDKEGKYWDDYGIEIHCSNNFPDEFPLLFETSDKIPKIADWHIYEDTLSCCVKVKPEEMLRCKKGITLKEYIQEEALPYLFNQTHRRVEGYYVNGEYAHGLAGIYQFYADLLKTGADIRQTLQLMEYIASHDRPVRTSLCFCGGKAKFRNCHREAFDKLKEIGDDNVKHDADNIAKATGLPNV